MKKIKGFTLAEVLITLSVLGIIAALTIPSIHRKWQDAYAVSAVRKAYSMIDNVLRQEIAINGPMVTWDWPEPDKLSASGDAPSSKNIEYLANKLFKSMNTSAICTTYTCAFKELRYWKVLNNTATSSGLGSLMSGKNNSSAMLKNGMSISVGRVKMEKIKVGYSNQIGNIYKTLWGYILVDINGKKGPNRYGYDMFFFQIGDSGIDSSFTRSSWPDDCNTSHSDSSYAGFSCSTWIIKHGNVDYKYRDVSSEW